MTHINKSTEVGATSKDEVVKHEDEHCELPDCGEHAVNLPASEFDEVSPADRIFHPGYESEDDRDIGADTDTSKGHGK